MTPRLFATLFYVNYLTRAVALYRSLERHFEGQFELVMLCMDDAALQICRQLDLPRARLLAVEEIEHSDPDLKKIKAGRTIGEYSWTCKASLLLHLLAQVPPSAMVVYLDADLLFFSDPQPMFDEWAGQSIAIHEHRFAPRYQHMERTSGTFNAGCVGVRNSAEGWACLARWRDQCIRECRIDAAREICGDQTYLNEWPALYRNVAVLQHRGVGLGPWNVEGHDLTSIDGIPYADGVRVIFYHYHSLRIVHDKILGYIAIIPATGYQLASAHKRILYKPYARALRAATDQIRNLADAEELPANRLSLLAFAKQMRRRDMLYAR